MATYEPVRPQPGLWAAIVFGAVAGDFEKLLREGYDNGDLYTYHPNRWRMGGNPGIGDRQ